MKPTLNGIFSVWSNSPSTPTGYGEQARLLVDRLKRDSKAVAAISNYGLEGNLTTYETAFGTIPHYPRGNDPYSQDVGPMHHAHFAGQHKDTPNALIGLYDCWIIKGQAWDKMNLGWWTPLDHVTMPPLVERFLRKENVTPIAMAPHGVRQMKAKGIECEYVPHGIDTNIFKPTFDIQGMDVRDYMGTRDNFVVGMVAANKASGLIHRKAFSENLLAFSIFRQSHPDAVLYLHTDPLGSAGGWNLFALLDSLGIPKESVLFPPFVDYKYGIPQTELAALYSGMDVLLAAGYGEGFGVPTVEAQACGTRVIGSNWAATPDLVADDGWLVEGQPSWDSGQNAWWQTPLVPSIVAALEEAYKAGRGRSQVAQDFASGFDADVVWERDWLPVLGRLLEKQL